MSEELKPCPFCGGEAERNLDYSKQIKCSNQNCLMSDYFIMTESSWNTRVNPELDRYKTALANIMELADSWNNTHGGLGSGYHQILQITQALDKKD